MARKKKGSVNIGRKLTKGSKRARQYEHIKANAKKRGVSDKQAKEMAARTTNKQITKDKKKKRKTSKRKKK